ncbi:hypothetical protein CPAR01_09532 [Colletotrichum paranaense]|uniref:Uncharacterized protein n=1 Tax=Colletotrichum paranaense TaxID=1914294 RepID=A0ABQ9SH09_9PEZI|nr:uncharacterized protein CPAR01_09532 [Colletotrichum paranaense]KAK1535990.1 hypothetical protein CPAR01_09532 [Colletotrichum paranaense]
MVTVQMRRDVSHVDDDDQKTIVPYSQSLSFMREHERGFLLAGEKTVRLSGEYFQLTLTVDAPSQGHACSKLPCFRRHDRHSSQKDRQYLWHHYSVLRHPQLGWLGKSISGETFQSNRIAWHNPESNVR